MKKIFFLGSVAFTLFSGCGKETIGPVTDIGVYFNELQSSRGDWLELYNSTASSINISGFKVYDDPTAKFTISSGTISANGYFILICDGTGVGGNASFKLSAAGESVYLEDNKGNLIDKVTFPSIPTGSSYARFPDGEDNWKVTGAPTKNTTNGDVPKPSITLVSRTPLVPSLSLGSPVTVSATVTDASGITSVQLFWKSQSSGSFTSVAMTLSSGVYSGQIPVASAPNKIEYYLKATNTGNDFNLYPVDAPTTTLSYLLNTDPLPQLYINEFMAFNTTCCPDTDSGVDEYDDWIEIYNAGTSAVNIAGMNLSDSTANPFKFTFPSTNPAKTTIPAGGYLIIWADESGPEGVLHANFQLRTTGEEIGLYYIDGRKIDEYTFGAQSEDKSWGRETDGGTSWKLWAIPTPGNKNQ